MISVNYNFSTHSSSFNFTLSQSKQKMENEKTWKEKQERKKMKIFNVVNLKNPCSNPLPSFHLLVYHVPRYVFLFVLPWSFYSVLCLVVHILQKKEGKKKRISFEYYHQWISIFIELKNYILLISYWHSEVAYTRYSCNKAQITVMSVSSFPLSSTYVAADLFLIF